ncbi:uncharacterized protein MONBRDRAFT_12898 [Monosiga brevicollis MX1]|uniref:Fe2OG dioxygenase domain-containing protein n=1 Tax=Monosiga brevicollis TaxID=81824 RepID=A9VDN5_MONBE|nr:uncharacterized protein MONBRDRAFT_12898 [Monosiga brevicollis MX1]EDQ84331.1 predicted protein [Monosiga brevicollis MX1]|eukprot:XP_001750827.1 hypothetical protein [Monosiga brevicollis MX1]
MAAVAEVPKGTGSEAEAEEPVIMQVDLSALLERDLDGKVSTVHLDSLALSEATAAQLAVGQRVVASLQKAGCFTLAANCIQDREARELFTEAGAYFDLPEPQKRAGRAVARGGFIRGYVAYGQESGRKEYFEPKEGFSYGYEWPDDQPPQNALQGCNIWPAEAPGLRPGLTRHFDWSVSIMRAVVAAIALGLGQAPRDLLEVCAGGDTISLMRLFRYHPAEADRACLGSSPHTDWGFLTLILQDGTGGLQFQHGSEGRWYDVPAREDYSLVVNGGDFLALLTGGAFVSPVHRVQCPPVSRLSFVFFYYPGYESEVDGRQWRPSKDAPAAAASTHNTLLDVDSGTRQVSGLAGMTSLRQFGDYINAKWQGVQRASPNDA